MCVANNFNFLLREIRNVIIIIGLVGVFRHLHPGKKLRHREKAERRLCKLIKKLLRDMLREEIHPKRIERRLDRVVFLFPISRSGWFVETHY
jgi:hypothetical protein